MISLTREEWSIFLVHQRHGYEPATTLRILVNNAVTRAVRPAPDRVLFTTVSGRGGASTHRQAAMMHYPFDMPTHYDCFIFLFMALFHDPSHEISASIISLILHHKMTEEDLSILFTKTFCLVRFFLRCRYCIMSFLHLWLYGAMNLELIALWMSNYW